MITGSNCCDTRNVHLFLRKADGTFGARQAVAYSRAEFKGKQRFGFERSHAQPHLLDWNRDGRIALVLGDPMVWKLRVGAGPLKGLSEIETKPFPVPELPDRKPYDFQFTDWDGDGVFDMLFAGSYLNPEKTHWLYDIYWCRNRSRKGEPTFELPVRLLAAPSQSEAWQYDGFAVRDRGRAGHPDLVVSVSKDWKRKPEGGWTNTSRLALYRQKAEPNAAPDPARKAGQVSLIVRQKNRALGLFQ